MEKNGRGTVRTILETERNITRRKDRQTKAMGFHFTSQSVKLHT